MYDISTNHKYWILVALLMLIAIPVLGKTVTHPFSYLPKPSVTIGVNVVPDRETYGRNEIITFKVDVMLDTLQAEKGRQYKVVIGSLGDILVSSQLMKSDVKSSYDLDFKNNKVQLNFMVQMLQDDTPPYIKVEAIRVADDNSTIKKQYRNYVIDQYGTLFITSPKYRTARMSGK